MGAHHDSHLRRLATDRTVVFRLSLSAFQELRRLGVAPVGALEAEASGRVEAVDELAGARGAERGGELARELL